MFKEEIIANCTEYLLEKRGANISLLTLWGQYYPIAKNKQRQHQKIKIKKEKNDQMEFISGHQDCGNTGLIIRNC